MNPYPKDWKKIVARIRDRAGNRCQRCGVGRGERYTRFSGKVVSERIQAFEQGGDTCETCADKRT